MALATRVLRPATSGFAQRAASTLKLSSTSPTTVPKFVRIVEVGPRDGLQNEKSVVTASTKLALIDKLYKAGLRSIEAGAFVSPKWVPQMADTEEIFTALRQKQANDYPGATFSALTPNLTGKWKLMLYRRDIMAYVTLVPALYFTGLDKAIALGVKEVAVFGAASESFSKKNINCTIEESLDRFKAVCDKALQNNIKVRGYVSCVLGCPYEGAVKPEKVLKPLSICSRRSAASLQPS
jgi:hydroxymethylglutaryl-CoA lyase